MKYMLDEGAFAPEYAHNTDAGMDLRTPVELIIPAHETVTVDTGIHVELPKNCVGLIKSKSGLNVKSGIQSTGVIDEGYTGSIVVKLYNFSDMDMYLEKGSKITQLIVVPYRHVSLKEVSRLEETERGNNGFGSTGK